MVKAKQRFKMESHVQKPFEAMDILKYNGRWYKVQKKPYEPEKQTYEVAWMQIKGIETKEAYRTYFAKQQKEARILYPSFRKDKDKDDS
jgi:lipocalin